ncbi:MAG: hypothetical protein ACXWHF_07620 [Chthoniobacterales bacterium]
MPRIQFFGRIHPTICRINLTLDPNTSINWKDEEHQSNYTFKLHIADGNVRIECDASRYEPSFFDELYRRSLDLARATVDVLAFGTGIGLTVLLEKFENPAGEISDLLIQDTRLAPSVTAFQLNVPPPNNLEETLKIVWTEPPLFFALRDLIEAITLPHRAPVCCGRAIEGLRNLIASTHPGGSRAEAWETFRRTLQLDQAYLKLITDNSVGTRHGDHSRISGETTTEITRRSWIVMDRFLRYRLLGNRPLPLDDFPLLNG